VAKREYPLRMVAWELTRNCNLSCLHCRASAVDRPYKVELTTEECKGVMDEIAAFSSPIIILTGGEPLLRADILELAGYGTGLGLRLVLATNGTLLHKRQAILLKEAGIKRISLSIDGKDKKGHDRLRGVNGSFDGAITAAKVLEDIGMPFQINTTVTPFNMDEMDDLYGLVRSLGAVAWHIFFLVPVGRGAGFKGKELDEATYERLLEWFYKIEAKREIEIKVTCAPHYYRIVEEKGGKPRAAGCLAGRSFMFISNTGIVQPCGYLEIASGDVKKEGVRRVWDESDVFRALRDPSSYKGKCSRCKYLKVCGGCRARAYELKGDYLEEEPYCSFMEG
jgi:heme b synthase